LLKDFCKDVHQTPVFLFVRFVDRYENPGLMWERTAFTAVSLVESHWEDIVQGRDRTESFAKVFVIFQERFLKDINIFSEIISTIRKVYFEKSPLGAMRQVFTFTVAFAK